MTRADLFREYARIIEMCDVAKLPARFVWDCIRLDGVNFYDAYMGDVDYLYRFFHEYAIDRFTFALCLLENKPVFEGDVLYCGIHSGKAVGSYISDDCERILIMNCDDGVPLADVLYRFSRTPPAPPSRHVQILVDGVMRSDFILARGVTYTGSPALTASGVEMIALRWSK